VNQRVIVAETLVLCVAALFSFSCCPSRETARIIQIQPGRLLYNGEAMSEAKLGVRLKQDVLMSRASFAVEIHAGPSIMIGNLVDLIAAACIDDMWLRLSCCTNEPVHIRIKPEDIYPDPSFGEILALIEDNTCRLATNRRPACSSSVNSGADENDFKAIVLFRATPDARAISVYHRLLTWQKKGCGLYWVSRGDTLRMPGERGGSLGGIRGISPHSTNGKVDGGK
jgi:hypothetical protein